MEVILLERIEKLGQMGDVVKVKPGYARNFLLPQKKALRATDGNKSQFEAQRAQLEAENLERRKDAEAVAAKLDDLDIALIRQAGDNGQLYGSVSGRDIADSVTESGVTISRGQVMLDRPIKELGLHPVRIRCTRKSRWKSRSMWRAPTTKQQPSSNAVCRSPRSPRKAKRPRRHWPWPRKRSRLPMTRVRKPQLLRAWSKRTSPNGWQRKPTEVRTDLRTPNLLKLRVARAATRKILIVKSVLPV